MESTPGRRSTAPPAPFDIAADCEISLEPRRPKKAPTITPRRFTRFFTPRPRNAHHAVRTSRKALREITGPALNRPGRSQPRCKLRDLEFDSPPNRDESSRKRKFSAISATPSLQSSPCRASGFLSSQEGPRHEEQNWERCAPSPADDSAVEEDEEEEEIFEAREPAIRPYHHISTSAGLLCSRITGQRRRKEAPDSQLWRTGVADFVCGPEDRYVARDPTGPVLLPFCVASCNTNSMIAIGEEQGGIHLVDSALAETDNFNHPYLIMRPHDNAIIDLQFSEDDRLLATASGDQKGQIIDMPTQTSLYCLSGHHSSVKQVQFQPGSGSNVVAACSRDGNVILWDLRCRSFEGPTTFPHTSHRTNHSTMPMSSNMRYATMTNIITDAHRDTRAPPQPKIPSTTSRNEYSITSLSFLGPSRPHLLVTASEASAVVRLWDTRTTSTSGTRRGHASIPVSETQPPTTHQFKRRFGLTSLVLSTDCSRLYTLCRDSTVYTYSTSHLITGSGAAESSRPFRPTSTSSTSTGLGPLYAFRHPALRVSSFYPKLALRKSTDSQTEVLAVASSNDCAVLFATDERHLTAVTRLTQHNASGAIDQLKYYSHGTPLIRGHGKEVTSLSFTSEGSLVSAGDDFTVRCWREQAEKARELRGMGERQGRRWLCGWADIPQGHDEDDEEG